MHRRERSVLRNTGTSRSRPASKAPIVVGICGIAIQGLFACLVSGHASAQVPVMAMPPSYLTYNDVTQLSSTKTSSYTSLNNSYVVSNPQVPTQFSFVSINPAGGTNQYLFSTVSTKANFVNAAVPVGTPNRSFAGLLLGRQWNGVDVMMNQCFGGGFAYNMQGSLMGTGAIAAPGNSPATGYTFASGANYNEFSFGSTDPYGQQLTNANVSVGDYTQGWANNAAGGGSMASNYVTAVSNDPFTARNNGAATPPSFGFPNQVTVGPNLPPQPATSNNVTALGFESPVYASSDALANVFGSLVINPFAANNSRALGTTSPAGDSTRWAVLMAFSPNRPDFAIDIEREYAALRAQGVPANHIAVLYGDGTNASLRIPGSTAPIAGSSMLAANNLPNINTISNGAGGNITSVPVSGGLDRTLITGLLGGNAATWTGLGLAAPPAGNTSNLLVYTTGHGSSLAANKGEVLIANERGPGGQAQDLIKISGPTNYNADITLQLDMARALPNLTNQALNTLSINGNIFPVTQVFATDGSAFDVSSILQGDGGPSMYFYDVTVPASYLQGGLESLLLSFASLSDSDVTDFNNALLGVTLIDDTNMSNIMAQAVDTYTASFAVPEPSTIVLLGIGLLSTAAYARRRRRSCNA